MGRTLTTFKAATVAITAIMLTACPKAANTASTAATPKTLYIASGQCYSGTGITSYSNVTASRAITKWDTTSGDFKSVFTDLNVATNVSAGTVPQSMIDKGDHLLVLTENPSATGGDRKIWKIMKSDPSTYITYATDPTSFTNTATHITRSMAQDADGSIVFSKSLMMEKVSPIGARIVKGGANPWVNSTGVAGNCFTAAATLISSVNIMTPFTGTSQGKIIYTHSGATAVTNRIGVSSRTGMTTATAADCMGSSAAGGASTTAHVNGGALLGPVAMAATGSSLTSSVYIPTPSPALTTGKLIVSYGPSVITQFDNNTTFNTGIVVWDVTETADLTAAVSVTFTNPTIVWRDDSVVWAPSAMAYDSTDNSLYVAVGGAPGVINQTTSNFGYNVEKFTLNTSTFLLTRVAVNNAPFIQGNAYTKCISDLKLADQ
jgi:hypothetical protein